MSFSVDKNSALSVTLITHRCAFLRATRIGSCSTRLRYMGGWVSNFWLVTICITLSFWSSLYKDRRFVVHQQTFLPFSLSLILYHWFPSLIFCLLFSYLLPVVFSSFGVQKLRDGRVFCKVLMMRWLCSVFLFRSWGVEREVFSSENDGVERWERRCLGWWLKIFAVFFSGWKFDDWLSTFMACVVCWLLNRRWLIFHVLLLVV